jgi:hypothetical protein
MQVISHWKKSTPRHWVLCLPHFLVVHVCYGWLLLFMYFAGFLRFRGMGCGRLDIVFYYCSVHALWRLAIFCFLFQVICTRLRLFHLGAVLQVTWGLHYMWVVTLALSVERSLCNTRKIVVLSVVCVCFLLLAAVGADTVDCGGGW